MDWIARAGPVIKEIGVFDWSINFGNILTVIVMVVSVATVIGMLRSRVDELGRRMLTIEESMAKLVEVLVQQGEHHQRMDAIDARITVLAQDHSQMEQKLDKLFVPASGHSR